MPAATPTTAAAPATAAPATAGELRPLALLVLQAGPAFPLNHHPCGSVKCGALGYAGQALLLGRVTDSLSLGVGAVWRERGTSLANQGAGEPATLVAQSNSELHLDFLARYQFEPWHGLAFYTQGGGGWAVLSADCVDGSAACFTFALPLTDRVLAWSARLGVGASYRVLPRLSVDLSVDGLAMIAGQGHVCDGGACATGPGTRVGLATFIGATALLGGL